MSVSWAEEVQAPNAVAPVAAIPVSTARRVTAEVRFNAEVIGSSFLFAVDGRFFIHHIDRRGTSKDPTAFTVVQVTSIMACESSVTLVSCSTLHGAQKKQGTGSWGRARQQPCAGILDAGGSPCTGR